MKTEELSGAELDQWVARAEGKCYTIQPGVWGLACINDLGRCSIAANSWNGARYFEPSKNWAQGGPILERMRPLEVVTCYGDEGWYVRSRHAPCDGDQFFGETLLVAAMRAYVASKFGREVADPG